MVTVPAALVAAPPLIEYCPPVILIGAAVLIPATVIAFEVIFALSAAPVTTAKLNASGVVSAGIIIALLAELLTELSVPALELIIELELLLELLKELFEESILELLTELLLKLLGELSEELMLERAMELGLDDAGFSPPPPPPPPHAANELANPKMKR